MGEGERGVLGLWGVCRLVKEGEEKGGERRRKI